jgi:hypothetical protein
MTEYTIYNTATGEIGTCGATNASLDSINLEDGQSIIEGIYEVELYKIIDGQPVEQNISVWESARYIRNNMLTECDWTQLADAPLTDEQKTAWQTYRQELRDLPASQANVSSIEEIVFPIPPSS